jgi:predicted ArsR family transcriptional regulator
MQYMRQMILEILKKKRRATVQQLSAELELATVTVRHHLDVLRAEGLVAAPRAIRRAGRGRPQYAYRLTETANDRFPQNYHGLAGLLLQELQERVAQDELEQLLLGVAQRMAGQAPAPQAGQGRLEAVLSFLNQKGYVAHWENGSGQGRVLHIHNCPYERVSQAHAEVCVMDAHFIGELVGAAPQRLAHMAAGDEYCAYLFPD